MKDESLLQFLKPCKAASINTAPFYTLCVYGEGGYMQYIMPKANFVWLFVNLCFAFSNWLTYPDIYLFTHLGGEDKHTLTWMLFT